MERIIQKECRKFLGYLLVVGVFVIPNLSLAVGVSSQCSSNGYTVATINGVFTDEKRAQENMDALKIKLGKTYNNQIIDYQYLLNPSHLAGLGDLVISAYQKIFDNETVKDYDLVEMLKDASAKVKTQKLLLVAHSQGNFYANSFYDTAAGKEGGVPAESIGVYAVATPASRVAGGGKWLTSDTDKVIADWVSLVPFKKIMAPNTSIVLAEGDDPKGHNFSGVYLKHRGGQIVSDIQSSLDKLQTNSIQKESSPCLAPPKLTLAHKIEGKVLAVVDPKAKVAKDGFVIAIEGTYQAGRALARGVYSLTNLLAGAYTSLVAEDNKTPAKVYSLWVGPEVNNSQRGRLTGNKIKLAEESLQVLQKQALVLQVAQTSRFNLDGVPADEEIPISRQPLDITEPKFVATIIPGFGGGGTGAVPASSSSSADSSSSAESSSSSVESSSSSLPTEEAGSSSSSSAASSASESSSSSSSAPDTTPPAISSFSISQCQNSLSSDGCLIATTTAFLSWASSSDDVEYFELTSNGTTSTTTATSTSLTLADNSNNSFSVRAKDLAGNWSTATTATAEVSLMPVVINEVAWAGNSTTYSADEWIELYNRTNLPVNLNNFILYSKTDLTPYVNLSGQIVSNGYYLLERTNNDTISNIAADKIYTGDLVNFGENIALVYKPTGQATTTIDEIPYDFNWYAGSDFSYYSMERYDPDIAGTSASNWGTNNGLIKNGQNAGGGSLNGTPKARNSLNHLINKGNGVYSSLTLSASGSPYFVDGLQSVTSSSTLTIEPGVVIKFNAINKSGLQFINGGKLSAVGSSANPIIFTSFYDDSYGGDTNGSIGSTSPAYGDWYGVRIDSPGTESTISRALFRYGGWYYSGGGWTDSKANLYIANSSASISDSIFEYARVYGAKLSNASSTLAGNTFRYNNNGVEGASAGLSSELGKLALNSNIFSNNKRGLYVVSSNFDSSSSFNSNIFTSNTGEAVYSSGRLGSYTNNSGSGNGVDAIYISGTITQNGATATLLANSLPYLLNGSVTVAASSTLAVNSGVALKGWFNNSTSYLNVYGNLVVSGTNFSDIVFGSMFSSPAKGNWGGVRLYSGSYSSISGATFEYANTALTYNSSPISLANVKFNENNLGVSADTASRNYPVSASGVIFTNNTATTSPGGLW